MKKDSLGVRAREAVKKYRETVGDVAILERVDRLVMQASREGKVKTLYWDHTDARVQELLREEGLKVTYCANDGDLGSPMGRAQPYLLLEW